MTDLPEKFPGDDQHALLASHGFGEAFGGLWVERDDLDEVAGLLGADLAARRDTTLVDAMSGAGDDVPQGLVWPAVNEAVTTYTRLRCPCSKPSELGDG